MIERGSYRYAADALRRLRGGDAGIRAAKDDRPRKTAAQAVRAEEVEEHALNYLYGRRSTTVERVGVTERSRPPAPRAPRGRPRRERTGAPS